MGDALLMWGTYHMNYLCDHPGMTFGTVRIELQKIIGSMSERRWTNVL